MSLWGTNDNLESSGTVSLNYANKTVTGSGTTFGTVGFGVTGDIIRFGYRGDGGDYFGDAIIISTASATSLTIGSTAGLSGAAIANTSYYLSELPKYTVTDHEWSNKHDTQPTFVDYKRHPANGAVGVGSTSINVLWKSLLLTASGHGQDVLVNDGNKIDVAGVGTAIANATSTSAVGFHTIFINPPDGVYKGHSKVTVAVGDASAAPQTITGMGATYVSIGNTIATAISAGDKVTISGDHIVSLASPITAAIADKEELVFQRLMGGYDRQIYGISTVTAGSYDDISTKYRTSGGGWVGVTTYIDCHGTLRVKSEILVATSGSAGITTGSFGIGYPTPQ